MSAQERGAMLMKVAAVLQRRLPDLADVWTAQVGAPISLTKYASGQAPGLFEFYGKMIQTYPIVDERKRDDGRVARVVNEPVGVVAAITWVMVVNNDLPVKTVPEFIALAKSRPGKIDYSSGGNGSPQHVAMEAFKEATGIDLVHIPYRGATAAAVEVMSNRVQAHFSAVSIVQPYIKEGRMRALGVPSGARSPLLPDVPTMAEAGVSGFEWRTWASFVLPVGTPKPVADRLNAELVKAVNSPDVRDKLIAQGLEPIGSKPEVVTQWTRDGLKRMHDIVQRAKIQAE